MNKNKKYFSVLSSAALGVLIASAVSSTASAKVTDYVAKDASGRTISFNLDALLKDYENKFSTGKSPMFDEYMKDAANLVAFKDDKTGLVSAQSVLSAYTDAVIKDGGKTFVLDTVTEAAKDADLAKDVTIGYQCNADGTVTSVDLSKVVKSASAITATTTVGVVPTLPTTVNVTLGDGTTKAANITWGTAATSTATYATAGTVTVNGTLADYNNYAVSATVTVNSQLAVQSVTAPDAKTLKVAFNGPVDPETISTGALNLANYTINGAALTTTGTFGTGATAPVLTKSDDNKSVTIDFSKSPFVMTNDTSYAIVINGIKSQDLTKDVPMYTQALTFSDTVSPTATLSYNNAVQAKLTFSEAMTTKGTVTIYDAQGNDVTSLFTVNALSTTDLKSFTIDMGASVVNGVDYTVKVVGASDLAGNLVNPNPTTFTIRKSITDTVAPTLTSIVQNSQNTIKVTYSEKVSDPGYYNVGGGAVKIDTTATTGNATVDSTGTVYTVKLDAANALAVAAGGAKTATITSFVDMSGNTTATDSKVVTFTADTTAPAYVSNSIVDIAGDKYLVVKYDDADTRIGTLADDSAATYVNSDGLETTPVTVAMSTATSLYNPTGAATTDSIKIKLTGTGAAIANGNGTYTVTLPAGLVKDSVNNLSDAKKITFSLTGNVADTTAPTIDTTALTSGYQIQTADNNTIKVAFSEAVDPTTARDVNNYLVGGNVVADNIVFVGDQKTVKITLKDGAIATSGSQLFTVKNVKDLAGNVMKTVNTTQPFKENVAPTFTASLVATDTIKIDFSEAVSGSTIATAIGTTNFAVKVAGGADAVTAVNSDTLATPTVAAASTGYKTLYVKLTTPVTDLTKTITITASGIQDVDKTGTIVSGDAIGNAVSSSTITVSK